MSWNETPQLAISFTIPASGMGSLFRREWTASRIDRMSGLG